MKVTGWLILISLLPSASIVVRIISTLFWHNAAHKLCSRAGYRKAVELDQRMSSKVHGASIRVQRDGESRTQEMYQEAGKVKGGIPYAAKPWPY